MREPAAGSPTQTKKTKAAAKKASSKPKTKKPEDATLDSEGDAAAALIMPTPKPEAAPEKPKRGSRKVEAARGSQDVHRPPTPERQATDGGDAPAGSTPIKSPEKKKKKTGGTCHAPLM